MSNQGRNLESMVNGVKPGKCDVRLTSEELKLLKELAEDNRVTKSDIMREALRHFYKWCKEK